MYIGELLAQRMNLLGYTDTYTLSKDSLVATDIIENILDNKIQYENIDELDIQFISEVLYCSPEYWADEKIRKKDWIIKMDKKNSKTNNVIGKLQQFSIDFHCIRNLIKEINDEINNNRERFK